MTPVLIAALVLALPFRVELAVPEGAPPDTSLTWRAWSPGLALRREPAAADEQVGAAAPHVVEAGLDDDGGLWTVLVEGGAGGDAWFALAFDDTGVAPLVAVPSPRASWTDGAVRLAWDLPHARVAGLAGWQILRETAGREPELVGEVAPGAASFRDDPPAGEHAWALRPVLTEGVTGPLGRASDPLVVPAAR